MSLEKSSKLISSESNDTEFELLGIAIDNIWAS